MLAHASKKPGCGADIMAYFKKYPETGVTSPEQVAVVGDRLSTDVLMANLMGSWAVWLRDGVVTREEIGVVSIFFPFFVLPLAAEWSAVK